MSILFQDTLKTKFQTIQDSARQEPDSLMRPVTEINYNDISSIILNPGGGNAGRFPFVFISKAEDLRKENTALLIEKLKPGKDIPVNPYHTDWFVPLIFISALILGIIRMSGGNYFRSMLRFIAFRKTADAGSREATELYQLPSTLLNLGSFISISLFAYLLIVRYDIVLPRLSGFAVWAISLGTIITGITVRHFTCIVTGNISNNAEAFNEYLKCIYESYRIAGIYLLILVILVAYTSFIPEKVLFNAGIFGAGLLYIMRVSRLLLIFIKRHISLFYYILYLCALEILPVVVLVKYLTGLV